ncbi:ATPase [Sporosalibacterium faouarense]|uniref:ATPase n=1 Tax=Sporosalibacterium faouarense TaxID=516123 RepID=UPI00141D1E9B|nr:ATPase [Sporosalibacterium faouarense]MTI47710.1 ATP synthase F0 subunit B [Bacillota bacterium]
MDVLKLLDLVEDILEEGSTIPFTAKVCVDKDELLDITREIRLKLPDEIKQAEWIKEERQRILVEAQNEADTITEEARLRIEELIEEDEVTQKAKERADEIIEQAQQNAKEIRIGAREYADQLLKDVQEQLKGMISTLDENRNELKGLK